MLAQIALWGISFLHKYSLKAICDGEGLPQKGVVSYLRSPAYKLNG